VRRQSFLAITLAVFASFATRVTFAAAPESFPQKPIRLIVGFAPGGSTDIVARLIAPRLSEALGQQVVIENRPGAGGNIAAATLLSAPPDGHTMLMCTSGILSIQPHLLKSMPFNPETDIVPVTKVTDSPYVLLVHSSLPVKNVKELVAYAKQNPGKLNFASSGNGTGGHLAGEMLKARAGVDIVHVPYKGTGQAVTDLLAGQVSIIFDQPVSTMPYIKSGKLRALAVASPRRLPALPEVPTVSESGIPDFDPVPWTGLCAAKAAPSGAIERMQREVAKLLAVPAIRQRLIQDGLEPVGDTPDEFRKFLETDKQKWGRVIKDAGITAE